MRILDELERRKVNTLDLPRDKSQWPVTVTTQELNALIRVARAADRLADDLYPKDHHEAACELEEALCQLREMRK